MSAKKSLVYKLSIAAVVFGLVAISSVLITGQEAPTPSVGVATDWSHHHVIYSNPGTAAEAMAQGRVEHWYRVVNDPRFRIQQLKRNLMQQAVASAPDFAARMALLNAPTVEAESLARSGRASKTEIKKDWSMDIGSTATVGAGQYPATYSASGGGAVSCANDFAVYNTGLAGGTTQASIIAFHNLYSGASPGCGATGTPTVYWSYNTGGTILTSVAMNSDGTQLAFVHSASAGSSLVLLHWKSGDVGTGLGSGSAAAKPVAPTNTYTSATVSSWVSCRTGASSCQLNLTLSGQGTTKTVTRSAPFYDNYDDWVFVGDDSGVLHKFTGVFRGTPAEVTTGGWPITVHSGDILTSPVFDANTYNGFVGDSSGQLSYVRDTGSTTGACSSGNPPCLGSTTQTPGGPMVDGPLLDPVEGTVFAFSGSSSGTITYKVLQANESLGSAVTNSFSGQATFASNARAGAFDNRYYNSVSTGHLYFCAPLSGHSDHAALFTIPFNSSGVMQTAGGTPTEMVGTSTTSGDDCSPMTEFLNGSTDYLFVGVYSNGNGDFSCNSTTCLYNFNITSGTIPTTPVAGLGLTAIGTSGIVLDNNATTTGASQIYFMPLANQTCAGNGTTGNGTAGCATQASQSAP